MKYTGLLIDRIMGMTACGVHAAEFDNPCWNIVNPVSGTVTHAVCGRRTLAAGYNGRISALSLRKN